VVLGVHVNWTAPYTARHRTTDYEMDWLDAMTSLASALFWTKRGNEMILYTDSAGQRYYRETGLGNVYKHIDVTRLDEFTGRGTVDPLEAPFITRMHVAGRIERPFALMDLDFVLFDTGRFQLGLTDLCCYHWELPVSPWYPPADEVFLPDGFVLPPGLDFATLVPNAAFLYVGDIGFMRAYARLAEDYVTRGAASHGSRAAVKLAIFADQQLLGLLARKHGLRFETLRNDIWTCGPLGRDWSVVSIGPGLHASRGADDLVAPVWVLDRSRFDERKESVECLHTWFEKRFFRDASQRTPRRQAVLDGLVRRLAPEIAARPDLGHLAPWLDGPP
jgi:hypothetical protein